MPLNAPVDGHEATGTCEHDQIPLDVGGLERSEVKLLLVAQGSLHAASYEALFLLLARAGRVSGGGWGIRSGCGLIRIAGRRKTGLVEGESLRRDMERIGQIESRRGLGEARAGACQQNENRHGQTNRHTRILRLDGLFTENGLS